MTKKLFTQIKNEWRSNLWLVTELLLVSVVMWYIVDYMYVKTAVYNEPRGFDTSHCYLVQMGRLTAKSPDYIPNDTLEAENIKQLMERIRLRPDVEAVGLGQNSYPYNGSNSGCQMNCDTLRTPDWTIRRWVTPDFLRVFRYTGTRGETPEKLAELLSQKTVFASDNVFEDKYGTKLTPFVGKQVYLFGDSTDTRVLAASLKPVRYSDFQQACTSFSLVGLLTWYDVSLELCIRVKEGQDIDFIDRFKADSEKQYRIGNVFVASVRSFADIRRNYQQSQTNQLRNYMFGMGFLLLNIFLGLLGTFWFRTQQRRGEIALHKSLGGTSGNVFSRQISEGILLLLVATIPAIFIDWNIANAELNAEMNNTTLEPVRFICTVLITFVLIALMIVVGVWLPARKAMKIQPAEALHDE